MRLDHSCSADSVVGQFYHDDNKLLNVGDVGCDERFVIERGKLAEYQALAVHHYKGGRPATVKTVYAMYDREASDVCARFRAMSGIGGGAESERGCLVGILVLSLPRLSCQLRDVATGGRYVKLEPSYRGKMLNREVRVISRVVIDPRYRGSGLAVRLVKHALENAETVYSEALAAMGRVNPFFERAGMVKYERPVLPEHARLLDVMGELGIEPSVLASSLVLDKVLAEVGDEGRRWFEHELRRWAGVAFRLSRMGRSFMTIDECVVLARDHLLSHCVYYLFRSS